MRRIPAILLLILLPALVQARSVLELTLDAGYSATQYKLSEGRLMGGVGYGADLGYAWFFHHNVGLGLGCGFRHYAGGAQINGTLVYPDVIDTDRESYTHYTSYANWQEKQDLYYIEFPLSLQFYVPLDAVHLWMALGANYSLSIAGRTSAQGDISHKGYYDKWHLWVSEPDFGFYSTSDFRPTTALKPQSTVAVFARFDIGIPINYNLDFIMGINAHYTVLSAYDLTGTTPLGFRNDKEGWQDAHYFMSNYSSLLTTPVVSGKAFPWSVDFEIGFRYRFSYQKTYPCHCIRD